MADPQLPAEITPHHHAGHHVVGRIRHHIHHHVIQAARPAVPVSDACGRPEGIAGQHGVLPASPAGRLPGALPGAAAVPKTALLGGVAGKAAAAMLGLAGIGAVAGTGALLLSPPRQPVGNPVSTAPGSPGPFGQPPIAINAPSGTPTPPSTPPSTPPAARPPDGAKLPVGTAIPEPSSIALLLLAAAATLVMRWRFGRPGGEGKRFFLKKEAKTSV